MAPGFPGPPTPRRMIPDGWTATRGSPIVGNMPDGVDLPTAFPWTRTGVWRHPTDQATSRRWSALVLVDGIRPRPCPHEDCSPMSGPTRQARRHVWLYMVDGRSTDDLARLDAQGFDIWRAN